MANAYVLRNAVAKVLNRLLSPATAIENTDSFAGRVRAYSKPDFMCIGSQKAGTQWLYDQLVLHPDVWLPPVKELHFFDGRLSTSTCQDLQEKMQTLEATNRRREEQLLRPLDRRDAHFLAHALSFNPDELDFEWYRGLFDPAGEHITGDITPDYSALPESTIKEITGFLPNLKIVFLVRDPVSRFWSALCMRRRRLARDGHDVDLQEPREIHRFLKWDHLIRMSHPTEILARWSRYVDDARLHVELFDDIQEQPNVVAARIAAFLGLRPEGLRVPASFNRKANLEKVVMTPEIKEIIVSYFATELDRCVELFGDRARAWRSRYLN